VAVEVEHIERVEHERILTCSPSLMIRARYPSSFTSYAHGSPSGSESTTVAVITGTKAGFATPTIVGLAPARRK
jgi:hypothetical protein